MTREQSRYLSMYQGIDFDAYKPEEPIPFVKSDDILSKVFAEVFAVNPDTGLPNGDLSYFLSPDSNPEIRMWLENNLLKPRMKSSGTSLKGVTDDLIIEFSRSSDESREAYAARLRSIYDESVKFMNEHKSD